jgi:hypothetical protein
MYFKFSFSCLAALYCSSSELSMVPSLVWECWQWYWVFTAVVLVLLESMETPKGFVEVFIFIGVFESSACIFVRC